MRSLKNLFSLTVILIALVFCNVSRAQKLAIPITSYGVWDRGDGIDDYDDPQFDYILGIEAGQSWSDIQPDSPDKFDFSGFQKSLDKAYKYKKIVKVSINVGPDSPKWIYKNGVPLVKVIDNKPGKHDKFPDYPYYLDENYKKYYFELIKQFSLFLQNQPEEKFKCIAFVQVKTGSTGDEEPYKGKAAEEKYSISKAEWLVFRLETFNEFKKYFNDVPNHQITLTFNRVDPEIQPEEYNWVMTKIDPVIGFGIKGGAYNRGHHLSGEATYKEKWYPYLVNPKGLKLFSASEMDQSWRKGFFAINYELGFYWAVLSGLNVGLSSTNLSKGALIYATEHDEIRQIYKMYNKYAQQVYPSTARFAYSVFHEGLNAADKVKFPEEKFGKAEEKNLERYANICKAYESRGARMDDLKAASTGQVDQRDYQTGYNDTGWEIQEGNYERFLTQINPDETSIGLFRVRGIIDENSSKYDRFARSFENATGKNTMYFKFDDEMFVGSKPESLRFTITWLDKNAGSTWALKYNNGQKILKSAISVKGIGDNQWKTETVTIKDAIVDRSGQFGSDFILVNTDSVDDIFNGIEVEIVRKEKKNQ
jgi:hypothetical protein